ISMYPAVPIAVTKARTASATAMRRGGVREGSSPGAVAWEGAASDRHLVNLVRAVVDAREPRPAVEQRERKVLRHPRGAVHLDGAIDHRMEHARTEELDEGDLLAGCAGALGVDLPRRVEGHQARGLDVCPAFGHPVLDVRLARQGAAERFPRGGVAAHQLERALRHPEPAHAVMDPAGSEAILRDHEAHALRTEEVRDRYAAVLVPDLGVMVVVVAHHRDASLDVEPRCVGRDDD